ncbi:type II toxin-antitoxin system RelE/ParE family toxin [Burkholderia sp. Bp8963]|uniref:type II toxin-antitoxin system RelE/ParE family toxin n=1 Tax=Burkholderia sp. Bp8963 TaxID=2184547 RepID=UPI000F5B7357|nr:type II toxin-antitoxin system RelE/ParE family toxin [Burkholderia sp. Bp8963]RQS75562.1 type II toxin-antitoxin system RelE/ParE family toxin [Burkholderia sp. Bp8963]
MAVKARQLRLTPLAESDLEEIWRYTFTNWSLEQADQYHRDLIETMEAFARGDKSGRVCTVRDGYFRYAVGSHVVFYREAAYDLDVIRILHQRMDVERHL